MFNPGVHGGNHPPYEFMGFGAMRAAKASEFVVFAPVGAAAPYALMFLGAVGATELVDSWALGPWTSAPS